MPSRTWTNDNKKSCYFLYLSITWTIQDLSLCNKYALSRCAQQMSHENRKSKEKQFIIDRLFYTRVSPVQLDTHSSEKGFTQGFVFAYRPGMCFALTVKIRKGDDDHEKKINLVIPSE